MRFLGPDPVETEVQAVLDALERGEQPRRIERRLVDCKEEPGRRRNDGTIISGGAQSDQAARYLAEEAACFANSPGGGALVVGFADDGTPIGTELEAEWLRHRIYEFTEKRLTVSVKETTVSGVRVLVLFVPEALDPIVSRGHLRWRVADNCVQVDTASWWAGRLKRLGYDWAGRASNYPVAAARPAAVDVARRYLRMSGESGAAELADLADADLLSRVNAVTDDDRLTNAAALLFVEHAAPFAMDYIRRDLPGGDSLIRIPSPGGDQAGSVLEELAAIEQAIAAYNPTAHIHSGLAVGKVHVLPPLTVREAIVNGLAHRDWGTDTPTTIEHVGATLAVTSPGGFVGGVTPENIITHPSAPRHRALAMLLAKLRIAEHEGVGVDRMVRDMLRVGYPRPVIEEIGGPMVRAVLIGGAPDVDWIEFLGRLHPENAGRNLDVLLLLDRLINVGWVDAPRAARVLQKTVSEAARALTVLEHVTIEGQPIVVKVVGTPGNPALRLSDEIRKELAPRLRNWLPPEARQHLVIGWVRDRESISTTVVADIVGVSRPRAADVLKGLEDEGYLAPGRPQRNGRGFFYVLAPHANRAEPEQR